LNLVYCQFAAPVGKGDAMWVDPGNTPGLFFRPDGAIFSDAK